MCVGKEAQGTVLPEEHDEGVARGDEVPLASHRTTALQLKNKTKEIMSLPCTVVCSANGVRNILDLTFVAR